MGIRGKLAAAGLIVALVPVAAAVGSVSAGAGVAGSVVVTTTADELTVDGDCSLREAFATVNTGTGVDSCTTGSTTIELSIGTYTFDSGELGPLVAETAMHLLGVDATSTTIVETGLGTAVRAGAGVTLFVQDLAISGGTAVHMETGAGLLLFHDARVSGRDYAFLTDDSDVEAERTTFEGGYFAVGQTTSGDITVSSSTVQGDDESLGLRSTAGSISADASTLDTPLRAPSIAIDRSFVGPCLECTPLSIGAGSLSLVNSTVEVPLDHPAIQLTTGSATIVSSTLHAGTARPAIAVTGTGTATVTGSIATCAGSTGVVSGGGNVSDGSCGFAGTGDVVGDPKLLAPAANGGRTKTQSLAPGSAAIDRAPSCPSVDQRNAPRPKDADDADIVFSYGGSGTPVVGDWDGDGTDDIGVVQGGTWFLRTALAGGPADLIGRFGGAGDVRIAGDWDGDGDATPGVVRGRTRFLKNDLTGGTADLTFNYGLTTDVPLVGDWDGDGVDTPGVARNTTSGIAWHLRSSNTPGPATTSFRFGP